LFLGYPIDDVLGFVKYRGRHYKFCGFWKVYGNVEQAKDDFCRYELCREQVRARLQREGLGALKDAPGEPITARKKSAAPIPHRRVERKPAQIPHKPPERAVW
jgi:hypothetical protein